MQEQDFNKIYKIHLKNLKNKKEINKSVIVLFSGIPMSGKTTIAKKLEEKYKAVRFNHDAIRKIIKKLGIKPEKPSTDPIQDILKEYDDVFFNNYNLKNKFIILDASIDRDYKSWFKIAKKLNMKPFVIRLEISQQTFVKRVKEREGSNAKNWMVHYNRWKNDFENCKKEVKADILLDANKEINIQDVYKKLDNLIG